MKSSRRLERAALPLALSCRAGEPYPAPAAGSAAQRGPWVCPGRAA